MNWDDIDKAREVLKSEAPEDAINVLDYAKRYGISRSAAQAQLSILVKNNKMRIVCGSGNRPRYYAAVKLESCPTAQKSKRKTKT